MIKVLADEMPGHCRHIDDVELANDGDVESIHLMLMHQPLAICGEGQHINNMSCVT